MDKIKVGRPIKYSYKEKKSILDALKLYIEKDEYPTMPKFCVINKISKRRMYEWAKNEKENADTKKKQPLGQYFSELIDMMNNKQESFIEENVMVGHLSPAFAIFKLKQQGFGWTDRIEQTITADINSTVEDVSNMTPEQRKQRIDEFMQKVNV